MPAMPNGCLQIGKIVDIYQASSREDDVAVKVVWYYRPEEALGGRKAGTESMQRQRDWRDSCGSMNTGLSVAHAAILVALLTCRRFMVRKSCSSPTTLTRSTETR